MTDPVTGDVSQMPKEVPSPRAGNGEAGSTGPERPAPTLLTGEDPAQSPKTTTSDGDATATTAAEEGVSRWRHGEPTAAPTTPRGKSRPPFMRVQWASMVQTQFSQVARWTAAISLLVLAAAGLVHFYVLRH
jgi:hypothetical protein